MSRPPPPHIMGNMYRGPRPFNNGWRPRGPRPPPGFQYRPNTNYRTDNVNPRKENNEEYWCETCDRGFPTADMLNKHKQQHQKCNIDGCQFVAHPKVITKHIQMQHSSGLYKKIAKLDNPEEINKWREERKKKYPTRTNIEKKAAECKEKIERGEKMALKQDRNAIHKSGADQAAGNKRRHSFDKKDQSHRGDRDNGPKFNHRQKYTLNDQNQPPAKKIPRVIPKIPSVIEKNKLKPFTGILSINMDDDNKIDEASITANNDNILIEDDYYEEPIPGDCPKLTPAQEPVLCGALTSLMCDYGSSDEETDEKKIKITNNNIANPMKHKDKGSFNKDLESISYSDKQNAVTGNENVERDVESVNKITLKEKIVQETTPNDNDENSDNDSPEEVKTIKSTDKDTNFTPLDHSKDKKSVSQKKNVPVKNNQRQNKIYRHKIPSTLLYKLLHKEIRQERNIVLQCIRYIKQMNYFD